MARNPPNSPEPRESRESIGDVARGFSRGDPKAVETVRTRVRRILAYRGLTMGAADRADIEQEVMVQIWQATNRPGFEKGERFWGFVEVLTARRVIDRLRTAKPTEELPPLLAEERPGPLSAMLAGERSQLVHAALARLSKPCRDLIYLQAGMGLSYGEIARITGRREGTLRVQLHRCVARARRVVDELLGERGGETLPAGEKRR